MKRYRVYKEFNTLEEAVAFQNKGRIVTVEEELEGPTKNEFKLIVNSFKCEYAGCGSHQMELTVNMDDDNIANLSKRLDKMK